MKSDRGAVTAELMVLMPALALAVGAIGSTLGLVLEQVALEQDAVYLLRSQLIGKNIDAEPGTEVEFFKRGRLECIRLTKPGLIRISSEQCGLSIG